jgi:hypothetical protein
MSFVGRAPGYPDYSSAGQGKYTPQIYSQKTLIKFYLTTVFGEIANTDYEGEISKRGDKVIIRTVPDVTIRDYVKGQDLVYETPDGADVELDINKAKYFALKIDSIDRLQNDINMMDKWSDDGGKQMAIAVDRDILSNIVLDAHASNQGATAGAVSAGYNLGTAGSPLTVSKDGASSTTPILDLIMDAEAVLSEQNVPEDDERWIILPTWACNLLQKSELRRADSMGSPANQDVLRNGKLGKLGQFTIFRSNNLYVSGSNTYIPFGHKSAVTFASQIVEQELLPHPTAFGQILRALKVYGYKTVKSQSLGLIVAHK